MSTPDSMDPHAGQPVLATGVPLERAFGAVVMVHGRGATARDILEIADVLPQDGVSFLAPQAAHNSWYPRSFLADFAQNEPWYTSAHNTIARMLARVAEAGIPTDRTILLGFSQGACLALEFVARNARRYGGVVGFSGGLAGPDGTSRDYAGSLDGTPVFLGCSDTDFHIPKARVEETAEVLTRMGGIVTMRIYPGMGHTINREELQFAREMVHALVQSPA